MLALIASGAADGLLPVALSFAVLRLTGSASKLGLVLATQSGAALLLTLAGGFAGDRYSRHRVVAVSVMTRMAVATVLAVTLLTGCASFALLLAMAGVYGCADGFYGPVSAALLPEVVARDRLARANAVVGGSISALTIVGPVASGWIVAVLGPGSAFAVQGAVLAVAVGCFAFTRLAAAGTASAITPASLLSQLRAGWAEFARLRWLSLLSGQWAVFSLVILAPVAVLGPSIALRDLGGPAAWGAISSCLALGAVFGQSIAGQLRQLARPALLLACLVPVMTAEAMALGLGAQLPVVGPAAVVTGLAFGCQAVIFQTSMQATVEPGLLSRVSAIDLLGSEGGQPIGYALAGPVAKAAGAHAVLAGAAIGMFFLSTAFAWLRPLRSKI